MKVIRIDGVDYPLNTDAEIQAAALAQSRYLSRLESESKQREANTALLAARADSAEAKVKELAAENEKLKTALDKSRRFDAEDSALLTKAAAIMGADFKPDNMTPEEIMSACVAKTYPGKDLSNASPDYIRGLFEAIQTSAGDTNMDADAEPKTGDETANMDAAGETCAPGDAKGTRADSLASVNRAIGAGGNNQARTPAPNPRQAMIDKIKARGTAPIGAKV